jgi:hypothetical protein
MKLIDFLCMITDDTRVAIVTDDSACRSGRKIVTMPKNKGEVSVSSIEHLQKSKVLRIGVVTPEVDGPFIAIHVKNNYLEEGAKDSGSILKGKYGLFAEIQKED